MQPDTTLQDLMNRYANGVPVYIKTSTLINLGLVALVVIALGTLSVNAIRKM